MTTYLLKGFMLGLAYVAPIGMQNIYVINTALSSSKLRAYLVALITIFFDITLALACFFGIGLIMEKFIALKSIILFVGSIAIIYIGIQLIRSKGDTEDTQVDVTLPMSKVILTCLLVTWANPQALIDGTLLLGGFKATLSASASRYFISGVCIASATWFLTLATIVSLFKHVFTNKIIKIINVVCGSVLVYYGLKLGYSFITMISIK